MGDRDIARRALLQQQLGRLDHRLGVEARAHDAVEQRVGDGDHRHALVMGHVGAHDRLRLTLGQARRREVERLVEAVAAAPADLGQRREVGRGGRRIDHGGERRRIGRDDGVLAQAALEAEAGHAEVGILIGEFLVARVVGQLGDAPRQAEAARIVDLPLHDQVVGLLEQAAERRAHDQRRHEVLEHRARPRDQGRAASDRRHLAAQPEPVAGRDLALGDRHETGEPGLRGEQVVATGIEPVLGDEIADRQQPAIRRRGGTRTPSRWPRRGPSSRSSAAGARAPRSPSAVCAMSRRRLSIDRCVASTQNSMSALAASPRSLASARARSAAVAACRASSSEPARQGRGQIVEGAARVPRARRGACACRRATRAAPRGRAPGCRRRQRRCRDASAGVPRHAAQALASGDQMAGQIAAVDRRDVGGSSGRRSDVSYQLKKWPRKRFRRSIVASVASRRSHRLERADPAEIAGGDGRQEQEAEIGRRGPRGRRPGLGSSWKLSGGSMLVRLGDERLEEAPGPPRDQPKRPRIGRGNRQTAGIGRRQAHPAGDRRREEPGQDEWQRRPESPRCRQRQTKSAASTRDGDASRHLAVEAEPAGAQAAAWTGPR